MKINSEINSRLLSSIRKANKNSLYWKKIFKKHKVLKKNREEFNYFNIPFLTKNEILEDQKKNKNIGKIFSAKQKDVIRVHKTSGTSTKPLYIYLTNKDVLETIRISKKNYIDSGLNNQDIIIHCLNFNMWSGGLTDYQSLESTGAQCIPFGIGNTELLIKTILDLKVNAISCTPSYMSIIEEKCNELGINPKKLGLKKGFFGGESLIQHKNLKNKIEKSFALKAIDSNYGLSEILSIIGGEATSKKNCLKFQALDTLFIEVINEKNKTLNLEKGTIGQLVLSTLKKEGQPLFRYKTNDIIKIVSIKKDKFKKITELYFNILGRSDQMLIVKGVNFFPEAIGEIIYEEFPKLNIDYRIKKPNKFDELKWITVFIEIKNLIQPNYKKAIKKILEEKIKAILSIKAEVFHKKFNKNLSNKKNIFI